MHIYNRLIIGGGASGLMFAANLEDKENIAIVEANSKLGAKILISGGGRCNFTNKIINSSYYLANKSFIKGLLKEYSSKKIYNYFTYKGLESSLKNDKEYFCKNSAKELLDILLKDIKGVELKLNTNVLSVEKKDNIFKIETNNGALYAKSVVVASGGLSFSKIGASSIGYDIAKGFGHTINTTNAALVGFTLQPNEAFFKELSGVSIEAKIKVGKEVLNGSLLFAHKGISGPVILNASVFWSKGNIEINFLRDFDLKSIKNSKKSISNTLPLPKRVTKSFLDKFNIEDKKATLLTKQEYQKLEQIQEYKFAPAGTFGYSKAEVTKGGICTDEIDSTTFESKLVKELYFLGEVLDVTGALGGYNFHFAFSSALSCARHI